MGRGGVSAAGVRVREGSRGVWGDYARYVRWCGWDVVSASGR